MKSIKQLRILYTLPVLLSFVALAMAAIGGRTGYLILALILLLGQIFTLQFFTVKVRSAAESTGRAAEGATLAGALFSTLWTTFAVALLITIKRH